MSSGSARTVKRPVAGCRLLGCVFGAIGGGLLTVSALAATGPIGGGAPELPTVRPITAAAPAAASESPSATVKGNPLWGIPLPALSATRERPLFSPSRRPPAPAVAAAPAAPPPPPPPAPPAPPQLNLVGTAVGGSEKLGIFVDQATKEVVRLRVGEGHGGWTLQAIDGREAVLRQEGREATLALPAEGRTDRTTASLPPPLPPLAQLPPSARQRPAPPGMWVDGDGQVTTPPAAPAGYTAATPPPANWVDGDGPAGSAATNIGQH
jgi:hypothetical protein